MSEHFDRVKEFLFELDVRIVDENADEELVVIEDEESGIKNLIVDCEDPILVLEQLILDVPDGSGAFYQRLLQMNRTLVHGAFALDEAGKRLFWRDTLQLANLDLNELEGSSSALSLGLAEHANELLDFAKKSA